MFCHSLSVKLFVVFSVSDFLAISSPYSESRGVSLIDRSNLGFIDASTDASTDGLDNVPDDGSNVSSTYDEIITDNEPVKSIIIADTMGSGTPNEINGGEETNNQDYLSANCPNGSQGGKRKRQGAPVCNVLENTQEDTKGTENQTPNQGAGENRDENDGQSAKLPRSYDRCPYTYYGSANYLLCNGGTGPDDIVMQTSEYGVYFTLHGATACKF